MSSSTTAAIERPPAPPFTFETAAQKIRMAEDAWNTRDPEKVSLVYTHDAHWRNCTEFINRKAEILAFLRRKWAKELEYRLINLNPAVGGLITR
jgi:uncharacterized protein